MERGRQKTYKDIWHFWVCSFPSLIRSNIFRCQYIQGWCLQNQCKISLALNLLQIIINSLIFNCTIATNWLGYRYITRLRRNICHRDITKDCVSTFFSQHIILLHKMDFKFINKLLINWSFISNWGIGLHILKVEAEVHRKN